MGDIGGAAQAGASVIDTAATDATQIAMQNKNLGFASTQGSIARDFNAQQAQLGRNFDASQQSNAQAFSAKQQVQAEDYNTQMSNTAMQRRVGDLRAAGLNPLLAVGSLGGASSPTMSAPGSPALGGPSASAGAPGPTGMPSLTPMTAGLSGALTAGKQQSLLDAQADNVRLDTMRKTAELPYAASQARAAVQQLDSQSENYFRSAQELISRYGVNEANAALISQNKQFAAQMQPLLVQGNELDNQRKKYGMPELATQAQYWSTPGAGTTYAGQQGAKVGVGGGYIGSVLDALRRAYNSPPAPSGPDIQAPQF